MASDEQRWSALTELRDAVLGDPPDWAAADRSLAHLEQLFVDRLTGGADRGELERVRKHLWGTYALQLAQAADADPELAPAFWTGRVAQCVERLDVAARFATPPAWEEVFADRRLAAILKRLEGGPLRHPDLCCALGELGGDRTTVWRRVKKLNALGLVVTRTRDGANVSRLTALGEQSLAAQRQRERAAHERAAPAGSGGRADAPVAAVSPFWSPTATRTPAISADLRTPPAAQVAS